MSDFLLRPMAAADLPEVLAVQAQCYRPELIESADALASRLALAPTLCWVAAHADAPQRLAAYLLTHPWPRETLPPLDGVLRHDGAADHTLTWFIHDMAVAPAGQGQGLAKRLYAKARQHAMQAGLRCSRLIAVQSAARWWQQLGYAPVALVGEAATRLSRYGKGAVVMGREIGG
ncbi:GNAT family N-acetyltransferase [Cupriavidus sp. UGS-1]|uniref:GNAT family N-acetyltransferase n=1 Tax=Cupriavidus sp. UGS-1 TaxID=2899826 RepID=UPI001E479B9E|nr:GNAT family N-acetyltransferase [Cupriavidus sp. UGS-1]MCD9122250.1 GNAT family N-acetyltransferase [Cupriavidus sp. UGS-1]